MVRQTLPTLVTMAALTCGLAAIEATRTGAWDVALRLILLAAVADGVDGALARRLGTTGGIGAQLDSLADIIAFGVAPAFLFSTYHGQVPGPVRLGIAASFVLAGAYRLARFQAQPTDGVFSGLPITVAGPLLAVAAVGPFGLGAAEGGGIAVGLAGLMVCRHPFPTLGRSRRSLLPAVAVAALAVAVWPRVETVAIVAALALGAYVVWGIAGRIVEDRARGSNAERARGIDVERTREIVEPIP